MKPYISLLISVFLLFALAGCGSVSEAPASQAACSHTYGDWSFLDDTAHQRTCTACGAVESAAHSTTDPVVTREANCTEEGIATALCSVCGSEVNETLPMTAHDFSNREESITYQKYKESLDSGAVYYYSCVYCGEKGTETFMLDNQVDWLTQEELLARGFGVEFDGTTVTLYYTFGDSRFLVYTSPDGPLQPGNYTGSYRGTDIRFQYDGIKFTFHYNDIRDAI